MAMKDRVHDTHYIAVKSGTLGTITVEDGLVFDEVIDRSFYGSLTVVVTALLGLVEDIKATVTFLHSDTKEGMFEEVSKDAIIYRDDALQGYLLQNSMFTNSYGYLGDKRYVKVKIVADKPAEDVGGSVLAILRHPMTTPVD